MRVANTQRWSNVPYSIDYFKWKNMPTTGSLSKQQMFTLIYGITVFYWALALEASGMVLEHRKGGLIPILGRQRAKGDGM